MMHNVKNRASSGSAAGELVVLQFFLWLPQSLLAAIGASPTLDLTASFLLGQIGWHCWLVNIW